MSPERKSKAIESWRSRWDGRSLTLVCHRLRTFLPELHYSSLLQEFEIPSLSHTANDGLHGLRMGLAIPLGQGFHARDSPEPSWCRRCIDRG